MKHQLMAIALVAVFALCALAPASSAADIPEYDIDMRTGDVFTYTPETSLPAKLDFASEQDWASWNDGNTTITATFPEPVKDRQLVIRAVWTSETGGLTQTAFQAINFRAYGHVTIDGASSLEMQRAAPSGTVAGTVIYAPVINEVEGTVTDVTCQIAEGPYIQWDPAKKAIVVKNTIPDNLVGSIGCTITATNTATDKDSNLRAETVTAKVQVIIGPGMVITGGSSLETYKGCTDASYAVTTNYDGGGVEITKTVEGDFPEGFAYVEDGNVRIDPSKAILGSGNSVSYTMTVTARATVDGQELTATKDVTVTVWKDLSFLTVPTIDNVQVVARDGDNTNASFSATIFHATSVVIDWGDGSGEETIDGNGQTYAKDHTYKEAKPYLISVTAANGNQKAPEYHVLYNAADGSFIIDYDPEEKEPEQKSASLLWLLFAAIAVMLAVVYVFVYPDLLIVGGAVISALISATLYIGWL